MPSQDLIANPTGETTDQMAWGDNFLEINGVLYSKQGDYPYPLQYLPNAYRPS